ncbi:hypothetical protein [Jejuia pallidilutea]|uniref:Uncharacterized protein n=2 Tax=Jejuia pallidilutea TaxID=504487 RepID=A0A090WBE5_9FLAO|nr:hypothetical protein [Jejuia pallidilutea]GAL72764.1 hypothetical protein JCM19302_3258 [Jejuia pallidilutea]
MLEKEFETYYQRKSKPEFPYFLSLKNINFSEVNESCRQSFKKGYYFIRGEKEEENFYWVMYFLNSDYPAKKLFRLMERETIEPQIYQYIEGFEDKDGVIEFSRDRHFTDDLDHKEVIYINRKGEIDEKIKYFNKFKNGFYLIIQNEESILTDFYENEIVLNVRVLDAHDDFGIIAAKKNTKYGKFEKIGLLDIKGNELIEFKFDNYEIEYP